MSALAAEIRCRKCGAAKVLPLDRHVSYREAGGLKLAPCLCAQEPRQGNDRNEWNYMHLNDCADSLNMLRRSLEVLVERLPSCTARIVTTDAPAPAPRRRRTAAPR